MIYNIDNQRLEPSCLDEIDVIEDGTLYHLRYTRKAERSSSSCTHCFFCGKSCSRFDCNEGYYAEIETSHSIEPPQECETKIKRRKHK